MTGPSEKAKSMAFGDLLRQAKSGAISRRDVIMRASALGVAGTALHAMLGEVPVGAQPASTSYRGFQRQQGDATTLTLALDGSPSDLDPASCYDYRSTMAILGPYEGLIALVGEATDQYEGVLAESWTSNEDKSIWTFTIREGVTFHDGTPLDAEAVRLSYERFITLGMGPVNVLTRFITDPAKITAPDARTVVFTCEKPQPFFEAGLASSYGVLVVNAKALREQEEDGDWGHLWAQTNTEGMGTGAYKIVEFEPGQQLVMERNEDYWRGWDGNHFERIVLRVVTEAQTRRQLLEKGEADIADDMTPEDRAALSENADIVVHLDTSTQVQYFTMTVAGALEKPEARQALCYAFPYQEVLTGVYGGAKQAQGAVAETIRGFDPSTFQYTTDLAKAKELLTAAGVADGTELSLVMESGLEFARTSAELFQANLSQIGISLDIQLVDLTAFTALFYGDAPAEERPNLMWWGWWPDYNDAWNHLYPQISCDAWGSKGSNGGFYCNQQVEDLLTQARDAPDLDVYQQALTQIQQIVSQDDPPSIYYVQPLWATYLRKDVAGFVFNAINIGTFNFWRMSRTV